jgi:hypothetical protein
VRLPAEHLGEFRVGQQVWRRYLIATRVPDASCLASTTSPNPPEPRHLQLGVSGNLPLWHESAPLLSALAKPGTASCRCRDRAPAPGVQQLTTTACEAVGRVRAENLQRDRLRRAAVAAALDGDGHVHGVLPGNDRLAERLGRLLAGRNSHW